MSLTGLFRTPTWKETMRALAPPIKDGVWVTAHGSSAWRPERVVETPSMPRNSASLIGTAFDYYARHRLARRRSVPASRLPLEELRPAAMVSMTKVWPVVGHFNWPLGFEVEILTPPGETCPAAVARFRRWDELMRARAEYLDGGSLSPDQVAAFCFFLARLDVRYRAGLFGDDLPEPDEPPSKDELEGLILCMDSFEHDLDLVDPGGEITFGPSFGAWSSAVGGADGDLLVGDTMIEIKTTAEARREKDHRAQVVAYALLAEASGLRREVTTVAIYYTRFRAMAVYDLQAWRATAEGKAAAEAFVSKVRSMLPPEKTIKRRPQTRTKRQPQPKTRAMLPRVRDIAVEPRQSEPEQRPRPTYSAQMVAHRASHKKGPQTKSGRATRGAHAIASVLGAVLYQALEFAFDRLSDARSSGG